MLDISSLVSWLKIRGWGVRDVMMFCADLGGSGSCPGLLMFRVVHCGGLGFGRWGVVGRRKR